MTEPQTTDKTVYSPYTLPQPAGLVSVKEYLLTDMGKERVLLLRWVKEMEFPIDALTCEITMQDAVGAELGKRAVTYHATDLPPVEAGQIFTPIAGIPVDSGCMHVRVRVTELKSGSYVYRTAGTAVTTDYIPEEPWSYDPKAGARDGLTDQNTLRVRSKRAGKVRFLWPAALITALLLAVSIILPYFSDRPTPSPASLRRDPPTVQHL